MNIHSSICVCVCVCVITISDENIKKMEEIVEPQNLQPMSVYMQPARPWTLPKGMTGGTRDYVQTTVSPSLCREEEEDGRRKKRCHTAVLFSLSLSTFII